MIKGVWTSDVADLGMGFTCTVTSPTAVLAIRAAELTDIVTTEGTAMASKSKPKIWDGIHWQLDQRERLNPSTTLPATMSLSIAAPTALGSRIERICGVISVTVAASPARVVEIAGDGGRITVGNDSLDPHGSEEDRPCMSLTTGLSRRVLDLSLTSTAPGPAPRLRGNREIEGYHIIYVSRTLGAGDTIRLTVVDQIVDYAVPFKVGPIDIGVLDHD